MSNPVIELLEARKATRSILPDELADEVLEDLAEAARLAPSCRNFQPWRYLFLTSPMALENGRSVLAKGNLPWAGTAPLLIIGYTREEDDCVIKDGRAYHRFDLGMSVMNVMLAATHHGLTARPMAGFDPVKTRAFFELPDDAEPLVMIAVGKPGDDEAEHLPEHFRGIEGTRERKDVSEIVSIL
jgi:nitroreductase